MKSIDNTWSRTEGAATCSDAKGDERTNWALNAIKAELWLTVFMKKRKEGEGLSLNKEEDGSGLSIKEEGLSVKEEGLSVKEEGLSVKEEGLSVKEEGFSIKEEGFS